ncbi:MAG TPA: hypothetical protein VJ464_24350 [Blastocatellia bacterium]|nr:hypothetical protein [Blastocatellia bacterium]
MLYLAQDPYHTLPHPRPSHTRQVVEALGFVLFLVMLVYLLSLLLWSLWDQRHPQSDRQARDDLKETEEALPGQANAVSASELYLSSELSRAAFANPLGAASPHATDIIADAPSAEDQGS